MINLKNNKGAITLYILISLLFFIIALVNVQAHLKTKEASKESEYQKVKVSYEKDAGEEYDRLGIETKVTIEGLKDSGKSVNKETVLEDENGDTIVIPKDFKVASDSAILVKDGIVVLAPDESEFVWVPVKDINDMVMCQGSTGENDCNITMDVDELVCATHNNDICGKLYAPSVGEKFDSTLSTQQYNETNGIREPAVLTSTTSGDYVIDDDTKGVNLLNSIVGIEGDTTTEEGQTYIKDTWKRNLQIEYNEMAISVYENKGFYVGRYETSLNDKNEAQSKRGSQSATPKPTSANTWYGLYQKEKEYSKKEYKEGKNLDSLVGSSMIWGSQYDQIMIWMESNGINVTLQTPISGTAINTTQITGTAETDKLNNIYDLLGCSREWTLEAYSTEDREYRGGDFGTESSPSYRSSNSLDPPYNVNGRYSSRMTLYIK